MATPMPAIRSPAPPGLAVLGEIDRLGLVDNAAAMGEVLMDGMRGLAKRFPFIGDVRGKGLLTALEFVADPVTMERLPPEVNDRPARARSRLRARPDHLFPPRDAAACRATASWSARR